MTDDERKARAKELRRIRGKKKLGEMNELARGHMEDPHDDMAAEAIQDDFAQAATALADESGSDEVGALMDIDWLMPVGGACEPEKNARLPTVEEDDG